MTNSSIVPDNINMNGTLGYDIKESNILPQTRMVSNILPNNVIDNSDEFPNKIPSTKFFGIMIGILILAFSIIPISGLLLNSKLENENWWRYSDGVSLSLKFDDGKIIYKMENLIWYGDYELGTFDYVITGPSSMKTNYYGVKRNHTIRIKDDTLTIEPALTSNDDSEYWYKD